MIVYGQRQRSIDTADWMRRWNAGPPPPPDALIEIGEFEAGVADALCPEHDRLLPALGTLRDAVIAVALGKMPRIHIDEIPATIEVSVPEGYAYYGLHPDAYARAALRFHASEQPASAVVIGIRSIGTSLSAAVAAALRTAGCTVHSYTVRPRGHPFDRELRLAAALAQALQSHPGAWYLIVDEGPGLSGSSFASVARALTALGVPDHRIVLFPSWDADVDALLSDAAKQTWRTHQRWLEPAPPLPGREISAGLWREIFYSDAQSWPAVHPQHERRKSLCGDRLWKFAGLGKYGRERFERARILSSAGFIPRPLDFCDGYLVSEFVPGTPASAVPPERLFTYLQFVADEFPSARPLPLDEVEAMVRTNVEEALGPEARTRALDLLHCLRPAAAQGRTVNVDGRMFPHEWIETACGYLKTDAIDHYDDHFFPGPQDPYWDLAMTCIEFAVPPPSPLINDKLAYYKLAYLAYRIGYCTMSSTSMPDLPDSQRFRMLTARYCRTLLGIIERH